MPAPSSTPPGPRGLPIVGNLFEMYWDEGITTILRWMHEHGELVRAQAGPRTFWLINHPDTIRRVFQENTANYQKSYSHRELEIGLGKGLLTSDGALWAHHRKLVTPSLQARYHPRFFAITVAETEARLQTWDGASGPLDISAEMMPLTLGIAGHAFMSSDLSRDAPKVATAMDVLRHYIEARTLNPINLPHAVPTPASLRARRAVRALDETIYGIIRARRSRADPGDDVLGVLLRALDDGGMTDQQLRDELVTLMVAGHETSAAGLAWTFYLLSQHPEVEQRVANEVDAVLEGRPPTYADLPRLVTVGRVIDESLRMYPPLWWIDREAIGPDTLGGYAVKPGDLVIASPYTMHRNPTYWPDPETFDPDRFAPERAATRPRFTYLPFGMGPRACVGASFALMEMKVIVAMVVQRYRLSLVPGHIVVPESQITLRPRGGLPMRVTPRAACHPPAANIRRWSP